MTHTRAQSRRGSVYLLVLLTAAFVLATGLAALTLETRTHERTGLHAEVAASRLAARSGLDLALQHLEDTPGWRATAPANGLVYQKTVRIGETDHTVAAYAVASDGTLDDESEPFELSVRAKAERAVGRLAVLVEPRPIPMDVLELGLYSGNRARLDASVTVSSDADLGAAGQLEGGGQVVSVSLESETDIRDLTTTADAGVGVFPRERPADGLVDTYASMASELETSRLDTDSGAYVIERVVIGPGLNPYGTDNDRGCYVIHNGSSEVVVRNARIIGTLITTGSGGVTLEESVNMVPTTESWPVLITRGPLTIRTSGAALSELEQLVNYNPTGLSLLGLLTLDLDIDLLDTYPNVLDGIVFTASSMWIGPGRCHATGSVIALGQIEVSDGVQLVLEEDLNARAFPPTGFESARGQRLHPVEWLDP
ncbi:MAG: hypothetical protein ACF8Q5_14030 [Phycisphaerales bacterium JB040]